MVKQSLQTLFRDLLIHSLPVEQAWEELERLDVHNLGLGWNDILGSPEIERGALQTLFERLAEPGIDGPHDGYEADLLIAGVKPIGYCKISSCHSLAIEPRDVRNRERLDHAVAIGMLSSRKVTIVDCHPRSDRFYCQPDRVPDMEELIDVHKEFWGASHAALARLSKPVGSYFGFTALDTSFIVDKPRTSSESLRNTQRWCRAQSMLMTAPRSHHFSDGWEPDI